MKVANILSGPLAPELGLEPVSIEAIVPTYLTGAATGSRLDTFRASAGR
jgi:NADH dehydrogenase